MAGKRVLDAREIGKGEIRRLERRQARAPIRGGDAEHARVLLTVDGERPIEHACQLGDIDRAAALETSALAHRYALLAAAKSLVLELPPRPCRRSTGVIVIRSPADAALRVASDSPSTSVKGAVSTERSIAHSHAPVDGKEENANDVWASDGAR